MPIDLPVAPVRETWTNGKPFTATHEHCHVMRWSCGKPGEKFRCALCGHKFVPGETVRWQYTNDTPGAGGNPFVCQSCDGGREAIIAAIITRREELIAPRNWWFRR
jgi:hypothetical protein